MKETNQSFTDNQKLESVKTLLGFAFCVMFCYNFVPVRSCLS